VLGGVFLKNIVRLATSNVQGLLRLTVLILEIITVGEGRGRGSVGNTCIWNFGGEAPWKAASPLTRPSM